VHDVGAEDCGPNTLNVIVPVAADPPPIEAETADAEIALPAVPEAGALSDRFGDVEATIVSAIDAPHAEDAGLLSALPS
jgi:hypothetical protein